jgi:hypothetical protein
LLATADLVAVFFRALGRTAASSRFLFPVVSGMFGLIGGYIFYYLLPILSHGWPRRGSELIFLEARHYRGSGSAQTS